MKFDFSLVNRSPNIIEANELLKNNITLSFEDFYTTYSMYLGKDAEELFKNIVPSDPASSMVKCVRLVRNILLKAWENGEKRLAGVEGVSNSLTTY